MNILSFILKNKKQKITSYYQMCFLVFFFLENKKLFSKIVIKQTLNHLGFLVFGF